MKKIIGIILLSISLFALDFTFTKAYKEFQKGKRLEKTNPQLAQEHFKKAFFLLKSIENQNSSQIHYLLGEMYAHGLGVTQNYSLSEQHFLKAIQLGNKRAHCCLAKVYIQEGKIEKAKEHLKYALNHTSIANYCNEIDKTIIKEKK
ncbi:MAG: sel1 repeat family protein [Epsilonproteobacteria bacterium]|nr:sel1 repeat family protein [Campylobacterota bacterium]